MSCAIVLPFYHGPQYIEKYNMGGVTLANYYSLLNLSFSCSLSNDRVMVVRVLYGVFMRIQRGGCCL